MRLPSSDTVAIAATTSTTNAPIRYVPDCDDENPSRMLPLCAQPPAAKPTTTSAIMAMVLMAITNQMVELIRPFIRASKEPFSYLYDRNGKRFGQPSQT